MFPVLQVGPVAVQTPGLILLLGLWLGLSLAERLAPRYHVKPKSLYNLIFITLVAGIMGARILYAVKYINIFLNTPKNLISLNPGLLDPIGGIIIGFIAALIFGNRNRFSFWSTVDALTPLFSVFAIFFSLSQFASGDAYGIETRMPWGIFLWGLNRHPTQIYSVLASTLILGFVWRKSTTPEPKRNHPGHTFLTFVSLSSLARLFLEAFRGDSSILINNLRTDQVVCWIILALNLWGILKLNSSPGIDEILSQE